MIFEIGPFKIDVDVEKTRAYYRTAPENTCTCDGCQNFAAAVSFFPREVKDFFERLGADLKKPAELMCPFSLDGGKTLNYSGSFYHLCGRLSNGADCKIPVNKYMTHIDENVFFEIAKGYSVGFTTNADLIKKDFPQPVLQMETAFSRVPWALEKKNPYG